MSEWLRPREVAEILPVTEVQVQRWLLAGELSGIKVGRLWFVHKDTLSAPLPSAREASHERRGKYLPGSVFMYGQSYAQVWRLVYSSMEKSGYRMPPRDRVLDRYWYGFAKSAYAEWSADKLR